ncbi:hypothetical protein CFK37_17870 [Virgibacillus phasianinus]|uniref:DUF4352 domain-containing protein n=1 Tax=Virgibacillus phasianinus TaxID=2017483 RepID=A0A220U7D9_9BACI|nr:hypothetical protein [Virgibacillus phasianinus]ASK63892.1 hypothetical protein CFK37_17870 [Virgibacillus phasianinus]
MKKGTVFLLIILILLTGCSNTSEDEAEERITNSVVSIGAVDSEKDRFEKQKLTYELTIANADNVRIVDTVNVIPAKVIKDRLIETKNLGVKYKQDKIEINGEIIFDLSDLTKKEITRFEPYIKGIQFIGDNNNEYLLLNR